MPRPPLPLAQSPRSDAYAEVIRRLRSAGPLARCVRGWQCWDGASTQPVSLAVMPWIEIVPLGSPAGWSSPIRTNAPLLIQTTLMTPGTAWSDAENLWQAVVAALFADAWPASLGVEVVTILEHASRLQPVEDDVAIAVTGQFRLHMRIPTSFGLE